MRILLLLITLSARALLAEHNPADVLMEADKAFDRDTAARGLEGWMSWFTEDARIEGVQEVIVGKVALRDDYSKMFAEREFRIHLVAGIGRYVGRRHTRLHIRPGDHLQA